MRWRRWGVGDSGGRRMGDGVGWSCSAVGLMCLHGAIVHVLYVCVCVRMYVRT